VKTLDVMFGVTAALLIGCGDAPAQSRTARIRQRGALVCGVSPGVAGFAQADSAGRYKGLDVDICRAVAAAILGSPDKVRYELASTVEQFQKNSDIDLVSRRLTWSLQREGAGLLFGPVMFYDGQGFLVPAQGAQHVADLSATRLCVVAGGLHEANLTAYFRSHQLTLRKVLVQPEQVEAELSARRCDAFSSDVSELGSLRSAFKRPGDFRILPDQISKEPLAQLVRAADIDLFDVLRWTVFALIAAEELGVSSVNVSSQAASTDSDVKRLLGVLPGNGKALGLDESWAATVIRTVGNYGEIYERNVGMASPIRLPRGLNALWSRGGLMFAPPLR
jgi:general L-amino acid transport system substrate-binding protein